MNEALDFIVCEIKINSLCSGGWSAVLYTGRSQVWPTLSSSTRECLCEHVAKDGHYEQISELGHKFTLLPQMLCSEQRYHHEESQSGGCNWYMEKVRPKERQGNGAGALHCETGWNFTFGIFKSDSFETCFAYSVWAEFSVTCNLTFLLKLLDEKKKNLT